MCEDTPQIAAVDLFCGAGGLSYGLQVAGIPVVAGIDVDPHCRYPFEANVEASFLERDVRDLTAEHLAPLWPSDSLRLLAGCAPCQPFSPHRRGRDTSDERQWSLLEEFSRLALGVEADIVTMENVPRIGGTAVFSRFVNVLRTTGYHVSWRSYRCVHFGLAQDRRRLVLLASRLGPIELLDGREHDRPIRTVRDEISELPPLFAGGVDRHDHLHRSRRLSAINLRRIRASSPGGTWETWPVELRAPCHRRRSGATFRNVYARMEWDKPAPTITTLAHNFGTGRFGHPDQDRPISLREAAMLQGFPRDYRFVPPDAPVHFGTLGRLIGNAVPPPLGSAVGTTVLAHVHTMQLTGDVDVRN